LKIPDLLPDGGGLLPAELEPQLLVVIAQLPRRWDRHAIFRKHDMGERRRLDIPTGRQTYRAFKVKLILLVPNDQKTKNVINLFNIFCLNIF
jgi:hypothetical protein